MRFMNRPIGIDRSRQPDQDCFAQFDAVFDSLATELAWTGETPPVAVTVVAPASAPAAASEDANTLAQLEEAFNLLDTQLAGASLGVGRAASRTPAAAAPALSRVEGPM